MKILAIESSCDETAAAVVENGRNVLASEVYSQIETHKVFGGVVPEVAAREHLKVIDGIVKETLKSSDNSLDDIDGIAVTQGPGLIGALLVGITYAKGLAMGSAKPLIPVNHVHAHVHGALLGLDEGEEPQYPALALVVSGGHTNLYLMNAPTNFQLVGHSIDDACGESFDKVAKLLQLGYPGGPIVEKMARSGRPGAYPMPRMVEEKARLQFSYSGLKTHIYNILRKAPDGLDEQQQADLCYAFQEEALGQLVRKIDAASSRYPVKSILIAGGVAANLRFKERLTESCSIPVQFPHLRFCSDNAAMIAALGFHQYSCDQENGSQFFDYDWDAFSRYDFS
ncbi:MAG: tRNA (adenosine(37)-N6)-threonylcarbamoyltransferase complex transferase subunit TsaD [Pseudobacteriovorax sp.]|nr:tRNA (adenosine(37)-N6)-threonylcarbamoyltransferase complex transferase subunit TsaD [Pseudobacteriovorax sp.]